MFSVDHKDILDHIYWPGNLLNISNTMFKYQYLTKVALNIKEAL